VIIGSESFDASVDYIANATDKQIQNWDTEEVFLPNTLVTLHNLLEVNVEQ
jgi:hypothetical protein